MVEVQRPSRAIICGMLDYKKVNEAELSGTEVNGESNRKNANENHRPVRRRTKSSLLN